MKIRNLMGVLGSLGLKSPITLRPKSVGEAMRTTDAEEEAYICGLHRCGRTVREIGATSRYGMNDIRSVLKGAGYTPKEARGARFA